jgi:glutathione S-transferase
MGAGGRVSLQLFAHPFSSYCQKVLIALWADETPFEYRMLDPDHPENVTELKERWAFGKFPLLVDDGVSVIETTPIIEHLHALHRGNVDWIPAGEDGRRTRFLDRFFDIYVMTNMQKAGLDILRPDGSHDPFGVEQARAELRLAYDWLEDNLRDGP